MLAPGVRDRKMVHLEEKGIANCMCNHRKEGKDPPTCGAAVNKGVDYAACFSPECSHLQFNM